MRNNFSSKSRLKLRTIQCLGLVSEELKWKLVVRMSDGGRAYLIVECEVASDTHLKDSKEQFVIFEILLVFHSIIAQF